MAGQRSVIVTRWNATSTRDRTELATLLTAYHLQTEAEKGNAVASVDALPEKYFSEIADPQTAFDGDEVLSCAPLRRVVALCRRRGRFSTLRCRVGG